MEKISIIIPIYNAEKYLRDCLDSVKRQTYGEFEAILIDDGSKDASAEICKEYEEKDGRFKLFKETNHGAAGARNIGFTHAQGDYIAFLDSDDWYDPDYLECLLNGIHENNADIFYCNFRVGEKNEYNWSDAVFTGKEALYHLLDDGCCNRTPNKLYKKEMVDGILFPEGRNLCEDAAWTCNVLERATLVGRTGVAKYNIRLTEDSVSRKRHRKESEVCGFYRNYLDRCEVLLRNYPIENSNENTYYRNLILKECGECLKMIISSGRDLNLWDVYSTARRLSITYKDILKETVPDVSGYFRKYKDYKKGFSKYVWDTILSPKASLSDKKTALQNRLFAGIRRTIQ